MSKVGKTIQWHFDLAYDHAIREVERLARQILSRHATLDEFIMAMGMATFSVKGEEHSIGLEDRAYFKPLRDLIYQWDDSLGLTGTPMRFTADGPVVKEW